MAQLFSSGDLSDWLRQLVRGAIDQIEKMSEDEVLSRSTDDIVAELSHRALVAPLLVHEAVVDGDVRETSVDVSRDITWHGDRARGLQVQATWEFSGDPRLFQYTPSRRQLVHHEGVVGDGTITVSIVRPGLDIPAERAQAALDEMIGRIRTMASFAAADAEAHNAHVDEALRQAVEARKKRVLQRRHLAGQLGFPLQKRSDAPRPVPLARKKLGTTRPPTPRTTPYTDEPALTAAQFEDAISVVRSTLLAMERTPSVASGKPEEELRDQILVQLNGTFTGAATGETFVRSGKTDILVRVEDRHVFVGECKWWSGAKACGQAIDQLLGYLPWRDEKAALILFIDRKDASAAIEKADQAIRDHAAFKREGAGSPDPMSRRNYVLGHPDDPAREIHLASLFAVLAAG